MISKPRLPAHGGPTAVFIRLVAFFAAAVAVVVIPAALVSTATGHLSHQSALMAVAGALGLILVAALSVRPFDPL